MADWPDLSFLPCRSVVGPGRTVTDRQRAVIRSIYPDFPYGVPKKLDKQKRDLGYYTKHPYQRRVNISDLYVYILEVVDEKKQKQSNEAHDPPPSTMTDTPTPPTNSNRQSSPDQTHVAQYTVVSRVPPLPEATSSATVEDEDETADTELTTIPPTPLPYYYYKEIKKMAIGRIKQLLGPAASQKVNFKAKTYNPYKNMSGLYKWEFTPEYPSFPTTKPSDMVIKDNQPRVPKRRTPAQNVACQTAVVPQPVSQPSASHAAQDTDDRIGKAIGDAVTTIKDLTSVLVGAEVVTTSLIDLLAAIEHYKSEREKSEIAKQEEAESWNDTVVETERQLQIYRVKASENEAENTILRREKAELERKCEALTTDRVLARNRGFEDSLRLLENNFRQGLDILQSAQTQQINSEQTAAADSVSARRSVVVEDSELTPVNPVNRPSSLPSIIPTTITQKEKSRPSWDLHAHCNKRTASSTSTLTPNESSLVAEIQKNKKTLSTAELHKRFLFGNVSDVDDDEVGLNGIAHDNPGIKQERTSLSPESAPRVQGQVSRTVTPVVVPSKRRGSFNCEVNYDRKLPRKGPRQSAD